MSHKNGLLLKVCSMTQSNQVQAYQEDVGLPNALVKQLSTVLHLHIHQQVQRLLGTNVMHLTREKTTPYKARQ